MKPKRSLLLLSMIVSLSLSSCDGFNQPLEEDKSSNENSNGGNNENINNNGGSNKDSSTTEETKEEEKESDKEEDKEKPKDEPSGDQDGGNTPVPTPDPQVDPKPEPEPEEEELDSTNSYLATFRVDGNPHKTLRVKKGSAPLYSEVPEPTKLGHYFRYWQLKTAGPNQNGTVGGAEGNNTDFFVSDIDVVYDAVFILNSYNVSFYNDDELISSVKVTYGQSCIEKWSLDDLKKYHNYREPFLIDEDGYVKNFNGWSTVNGSSSGTQLDGLPKITQDTNYYAAHSKTSEKVFAYEWNYDSKGVLTREEKYTIDDLKASNRIVLEGTTLRSFVKFQKKATDYNYGYNLYLNDNSITKIGAKDLDKSYYGLSTIEATKLNMSSIVEIEKEGLTLTTIKTISAKNLTKLGESAIGFNASLTSYSFPNLQYIGVKAFENCASLKDIVIPKYVATIDRDSTDYRMPFAGCQNIETIKVDENNSVYRSENNNTLITKANNELLLATNTTTSVPSSVKKICKKSFDSLPQLTEVTIQNTINSIEEQAFSECNNLVRINFNGTKNTFLSKCPSNNANNIFYRKANTVKIACYDDEISV